MNKITASPEKNTQLLSVRVDELRHALQQINPKQVASHAGAHYSDDSDNGMFEFEFLGAPTLLSYP
jgi:hypothetical protein